ncbi:MAG: methyltransferase domain-containing protein [Candidatus Electrothrix sp. AR4]|nr:methyltransferase domain-containing protein [Candidatus Electrothrix sp. AR4]
MALILHTLVKHLRLYLGKINRLIIPKNAVVWPDLEREIGDWRKYLKGRCLNAGAGNRDISHLIEGELVNLDIEAGHHNKNIDIFAPLHNIPVPSEHFNSIICNAVLEHVINPHDVLDEFYRILKKNGNIYLCVPFLQPYHADPNDYQRYTLDGLHNILEQHKFKVIKSEPVHTVYHTLGWIIEIWLNSKSSIFNSILRCLLFPIIRNRTRFSKNTCLATASAFRVVAKKVLH